MMISYVKLYQYLIITFDISLAWCGYKVDNIIYTSMKDTLQVWRDVVYGKYAISGAHWHVILWENFK